MAVLALAERQRHLVRLAGADVDRKMAKTFKVGKKRGSQPVVFVLSRLPIGGQIIQQSCFLLPVTPHETAEYRSVVWFSMYVATISVNVCVKSSSGF